MDLALTNGTPHPIPTAGAGEHLTFLREVIDPLSDTDVFEVIASKGRIRFRMTRADFYSQFPEAASSASYRETGKYHYPVIPYKAYRFLVRD